MSTEREKALQLDGKWQDTTDAWLDGLKTLNPALMSDRQLLEELVLGQRQMRVLVRQFNEMLSQPGALMKMMSGAFKR